MDALDLAETPAARKPERRADRDLRGAQLLKEAVLVENRLAAPATGPVELDDDVRLVPEAEVVDAVLEAGERGAVARRLESPRLHRLQHPVRRELEEELGHERGRIQRPAARCALPGQHRLVRLVGHLRASTQP
jgi:hypothetical protein